MDLATRDLGKRVFGIMGIVVLLVLGLSIGFMAFLFTQKISLFSVAGESMEPNLHNRSVVVLKQAEAVEKGQLVFFKKPNRWNEYVDTDAVLVKRIVASPGDTIAYDGKVFTVNGETLYDVEAEAKQNGYQCDADPEFSHTLNRSQIFVKGDNTQHSLDSLRIFCDGNADKMFLPKSSVIDYGHPLRVFN